MQANHSARLELDPLDRHALSQFLCGERSREPGTCAEPRLVRT
jgi:hypothetical protein